MSHPHYFIGIDIGSEELTATIMDKSFKHLSTIEKVSNSLEGFQALEKWFSTYQVTTENALICMESTGVYNEALCYFLFNHSYSLVVESPSKVKRAFLKIDHKTDVLDSAKISEYAIRFYDKLSIWKPADQIVEQIRMLLSSRELLVEQKAAQINALKALKRKVIRSEFIESVYEKNIAQLKADIKAIEKQIQHFIDQNSRFKHMDSLLKKIPNVKLLMIANILVLTNGFQRLMNYPQMAAYLGICPLQYTSGKRIYKKPTSKGFGPNRLRKLLHLAAMNLKRNVPKFREYYLQKEAQGKAASLILNNIGNKLLRIICAIMNSKQSYQPNHISINPYLINA